MVNAFNMIDGINGLVLLLSFSICFAAILSTYTFVTTEINFYFVALAFSILGILILNFPFGRIFLGDYASYFAKIIKGLSLIAF